MISFKKFINNLTFIDLFAGIGGFHYALHKLGLKCVFASEINKDARISYETNFKKISSELFKKNNFNEDIYNQEKNRYLILIYVVQVFRANHLVKLEKKRF